MGLRDLAGRLDAGAGVVSEHGAALNRLDPGARVFGADAPEDEARRLATRRGQVVFVLQFPREGQQGFLTGTVRLSGPSQTEHILTRVEALDQM